MTMQMVVQLNINDNKAQQKVLEAVSSLPGVQSLAIDMNEKKLTVIGDTDPIQVVSKLRKKWFAQLLTAGPPKEPEKKTEKVEDKPKEISAQQANDNWNNYPYYYYPPYVYKVEETPRSCFFF